MSYNPELAYDDLPQFQRTVSMNTTDLSAQRRGNQQREPQLEILEYRSDAMKFSIKGSDVSMVNSLRRIMYSEVSTMALHSVEIIANTSCLTDEFLAHRLGLIPLTSSTVADFNDFRKCDCKMDPECKLCTVTFSLDVRNDLEQPLNVTTDDLHSTNLAVVPIQSGDFPILIAKLATNQELRLRIIARKGTGQEHAKFCPVSVAVFQFQPDIRINENILANVSDKIKDDIVKSCPQGVFELNSFSKSIDIVNLNKCMYCMECTKEATETHGISDLIFVGTVPGHFIFDIETVGQLSPDEVLLAALDVMRKKISVVADVLRQTPQH